ncbi:MAG: hypothetical protein CL886_07815 [Dehalococcoidia bacterium]|nr:hypothetical protein [Dehalococcoidia bacterium]
MNKVSVTTPNGSHLIIEVNDPEVLYKIIGMVTSNDNPGMDVGTPTVEDEHVECATETYSDSYRINQVYSNGNGHHPVNGHGSSEEHELIKFCRSSNPMGDMRKVVLVSEAASRYLNEQMVDCDRLGYLFDLVGWQRPHSFIQTLRNAARSKFRWMERVPGRSGQYMVTDTGRDILLKTVGDL